MEKTGRSVDEFVAQVTPATRRTLAQLLTRPQFSAEEVRTLRGMIRALAEGRRKKRA